MYNTLAIIFQIFRTALFVGVVISSCSFYAQNSDEFTRYVDSASVYVHSNPELAWKYLDSIPTPLAKYIDGRRADYYRLKGILYFKSDDQARLFNSFILSVKFGDIEKNYNAAGMSSLDLFTNAYIVKKDTTAYKFLEDAKRYFTLANDKNGLIEVAQMPAYVAFQNHEFEKSNSILLKDLELYKSAEDDAYYYLFAIYMIADNFIHLNDLENASKYFKVFESLEHDPTIDAFNFRSYQVNLNLCMASIYLSKKEVDSTLLYLDKAKKSKDFMDYVAIKDFYRHSSEVYDLQGNTELAKAYNDSLKSFENSLLEKNINASFDINESLLETEEELKTESKLKLLNRTWIVVLLVAIALLIVFFILYRKRINKKLNNFINQRKSYSQLSSNYEKLKIKTLSLEEYINEIKKEVKTISTLEDLKSQRQKIKELYKSIHLESSTIISNGENHLKLISELNIGFFNELKSRYPQLNDSEILVCYYLAMGFKNKEIAQFLNRSTRAIESYRYRVRKKMQLEVEELATLLESILNTHKELKLPPL